MVDTQKGKEDIRQPDSQAGSLRMQSERGTGVPEQHPAREETYEQPLSKEIQSDKEEGFLDETIEGLKTKLRRPQKQKPTNIPQFRDELTVKVEKIMEEGLVDAFKELDTIEREEFKMKGEETAYQIRELLKATHVKIKKIFRLLFSWLKLLPGINRFYLEQEAKIKADKIMSLKAQDDIERHT